MAKITRKNGQMQDQDQRAYLNICQMLFKKELNPKQKIAYRDLADRLNVSTTPVIHALKRLEYKGILRREPNKGHFINVITAQDVEEIFDIRLAVEVMVLPKTVERLNSQGLSQLEAALEKHDAAIAANNRFDRIMTDLRFHMVLAALSKTKTQVVILEDLFDRLLLKYSDHLFFYSMIDASQSEHYAVIDAIKAKDASRAQESLTAHLKNVKQHILKGFEQPLGRDVETSVQYQSFEDIKDGDLFV